MMTQKTPWLLRRSPLSQSSRIQLLGPVLLLAVCGGALVGAPFVLPDGYDWLIHSLSEGGAQNTEGAWITRGSFLLFAISVLWIACLRWQYWPISMGICLVGFGLSLIGVALFDHRPWISELPVDEREDLYHSVFANLVGFSFCLAMLASLWRRSRGRKGRAILDLVALSAAVLLPLGTLFWPEVGGLLQRLLFLVSMIWLSIEALCPALHKPVPTGRKLEHVLH